MLSSWFRRRAHSESVQARLRKYPWPYRAAIAFSNDCDFLSVDAAFALQRLFNSDQSEGGLALEFADSFFFYENGKDFHTYSYFEGRTKKHSLAAPMIRNLLASGHIDTTHAIGDFEKGGFNRKLVEAAVLELDRCHLRIPVFTNHGGHANVQNIGRVECLYTEAGDDLNSPFYILDLLDDVGIRYYWTNTSKTKWLSINPTGDLVTEHQRRAPRSGEQNSYRVVPLPYTPAWNYNQRSVFEAIRNRSNAILQGFVRYDGFLPDGDSGVPIADLLTQLGVRAGPNIGRVAISLSHDKLDRLVESEGCCFLYQHFSTLAHRPARVHISNALEFHPANLQALKGLKKHESAGRIWVAAQAILLDYLYMLNTTVVSIVEVGDGGQVRAHVRPREGYADRGYAGLTFEVPPHSNSATISTDSGALVEAAVFGPDGEGLWWASIRPKRLPKLDWRHLADECGIKAPVDISVKFLDGEKPVSLWYPD